MLTRMLMLMSMLIVLLGAAPASAVEHAFDLEIAPSATQRIALGRDELAEAGSLRVVYQRDRKPDAAERDGAFLDVCLVTSDQRFFALAEPLPLDAKDGSSRFVLDAADWSGVDGALGADALGAVSYLLVRIHASSTDGRVSGTISTDHASTSSPSFTVDLVDGGVIDRGPWRELRVRLEGHRDGERGEVDLVDGERRLPLFLDQPLASDGEHWHARGAPHWTLRLRAGEQPSGHLEWRLGSRAWKSSALPVLATVGTQALPVPPRQALPMPHTPAWSGRASSVLADGTHQLGPRVELPACPAPILAWNDRWNGFRGPRCVSWPEAAACDAAFAAGVDELDLLPQLVLEDHGTFRFGLSPWHADQGGVWRVSRDVFTDDAPWVDWRAHARAVVARARAVPGLTRWRLGVTQGANGVDEYARLRSLIDDLAAMVARCDGRPLLILNAQAVDYAYGDKEASKGKETCWYSFEDGAQDWQAGPLPIRAELRVVADLASDGKMSLAVPLSLQGGHDGERVGGAFVAADANLFSLDRLEFDAAASFAGKGDGDVQLYAWATDEDHRWYQQRLAAIGCDRRWNTVAVPFADDAPWEPVGHASPWCADVRRRVRRLGIVGFSHQRTDAAHAAHVDGAASATLYIDRVRRLGWPLEAPPELSFRDLAVGGQEVALYAPLRADFQLSIQARNPYDPDHADVVGEVEGPKGEKRSYPAYWAEPMELIWANGTERVAPAGTGSWHWRFTPPTRGVWRWRLHARVKYHNDWKEAIGEWQQATVGEPAAESLPPLRVSAKDPTCFETCEGAFFYPIGINLRSPGDGRQDQVLGQLHGQSGRDVNDIERPLFRSLEFERMGTRAYERWLPRLRKAGINWARVWMCPWWCGLEWTRAWDGFGGLTWYNQASAARLDRVLDLAEQNRIYVQIELQNHGMVGESADSEWQDSPYARHNGGPCNRSYEYFSRDDIFPINAKRLRYTLARWGWRSHLAAWVLCSELEFTGGWGAEAQNEDTGHSPSTERWLRQSLDWFTANDPQARPVSIHFSHPWVGAQLWTVPGLGFNNSNAYTGFQDFGRLSNGQWNRQRDLPTAIDLYLEQHFPPWRLKRPTIIGEWGGHWSDNDTRTLGQELHAGLWLQAVTPYAANTGFWWWLWLDATDKWSEYARIASFVDGDDRRGLDLRPAKPTIVNGGSVTLITGMSSATSHRYYAWLKRSDQQPGLTSQNDAGQARIETGQPGSVWKMERWSCADGTRQASAELSADTQGVLLMPLGVVSPDAAFKLTRTGLVEK